MITIFTTKEKSLPQRKIRSAVIFVVLLHLTSSQSPQSVSLKSDLHDTYAAMVLQGEETCK